MILRITPARRSTRTLALSYRLQSPTRRERRRERRERVYSSQFGEEDDARSADDSPPKEENRSTKTKGSSKTGHLSSDKGLCQELGADERQ
mmetsp:Transcript_15060/g.25077  ORF Transcript_15060/g.25077 Transcript_15060/m.25077 type:complete len:91 (-) Transcript_15060:1828-2100(-)